MSQSPLMVFPSETITYEKIPFYKDGKLMLSLIIGILSLIYGLNKAAIAFLVRFFYVPVDNYKQLIMDALNSQNGTIRDSKVGVRKGSLLRRIILASSKPQIYSTIPLNNLNGDANCNDLKYDKVRLAKLDRVETNASFENDLKPRDVNDPSRKLIYGIFHPFCDDFGGGERVLYECCLGILKENVKNIVVIYSFTNNNSQSVSNILKNVKLNFGLDLVNGGLNDRLVFIQLPNHLKWCLIGSNWKFASLIMQCLSSIYISILCFYKLPPDIFIDTMGYPFIYPWISGWLSIPIITYIHYPLVSNDMLNKLNLKSLFGLIKYVYWSFIMKLYEITGTFVDVTFVNSTWTLEHIKKCWKSSVDMYPPNILYPPIGIDDEEEIDVELKREKIILYLAQFRGEKRHDLAIKEFAKFNESNPNNEYILQFIGSTRNEKDENLVSDLKKLAISLKIDNKIIFKLNESYNEIKKMMKISEFGLNTMWNEHFGISIVEYMANGMIPIVHASAGPLKDIVRSIDPKTKEIMSVEQGLLSSNLNTKSGFFFKDKSDPDYDSNTKFPTLSQVFNQISELKQDEKIQIRSNALYVYQKKFTNKEFQDSWIKAVKFTSKLEQYKRGLKGKVESVY